VSSSTATFVAKPTVLKWCEEAKDRIQKSFDAIEVLSEQETKDLIWTIEHENQRAPKWAEAKRRMDRQQAKSTLARSLDVVGVMAEYFGQSDDASTIMLSAEDYLFLKTTGA
jgi:Zn-dependent M32 family carboxypeptidase